MCIFPSPRGHLINVSVYVSRLCAYTHTHNISCENTATSVFIFASIELEYFTFHPPPHHTYTLQDKVSVQKVFQSPLLVFPCVWVFGSLNIEIPRASVSELVFLFPIPRWFHAVLCFTKKNIYITDASFIYISYADLSPEFQPLISDAY